ncbi:MAG: hypothetical protein H7282_04885 [Cytophagaceae bacterium]|nr:hypothetical protein [Cytophagaceae bacterium]
MKQGLTKVEISELTLSTVGIHYNANTSVVLRSNGNPMVIAASMAPKTLSEALEAPKINFLLATWGEDNVESCLLAMLTDSAKVLGFNTAESGRILGLMTRDFLDMCPDWSIEDFMIFCQRVRRREFGKTFGKTDWQVFYQWRIMYFNERMDEIEKLNKSLKEKTDQESETVTKATPDKWKAKFEELIAELESSRKKDSKDYQEHKELIKQMQAEYMAVKKTVRWDCETDKQFTFQQNYEVVHETVKGFVVRDNKHNEEFVYRDDVTKNY